MVVKFGETMKISPKIMSSLKEDSNLILVLYGSLCYGQTFHKISCDHDLRYKLRICLCVVIKNPPHELLISLGIQ